jgi:hypothetical protein|tara:strand:+ start:976 stop:1353 length:378 start_codon:yes stop_codon:yes gene_type:complete
MADSKKDLERRRKTQESLQKLRDGAKGKFPNRGQSKSNPPRREIYTVSKGDTMYDIALGDSGGSSIRSSTGKAGFSPREALEVVKKMAKASGIKDPDKIKPGDKVVVGEFRNGGKVSLGEFKGSF